MSLPYEQEASTYVLRLRNEIDTHPFTAGGTSAFHMVVLFDRLRMLLERTNRETAAWAGVKNDVY